MNRRKCGNMTQIYIHIYIELNTIQYLKKRKLVLCLKGDGIHSLFPHKTICLNSQESLQLTAKLLDSLKLWENGGHRLQFSITSDNINLQGIVTMQGSQK